MKKVSFIIPRKGSSEMGYTKGPFENNNDTIKETI